MKWFEEGLDKAALKQRYRELTKQYHPDLHPKEKEYVAIMQEINGEYDSYAELSLKTMKVAKEEVVSLGKFKYYLVKYDIKRGKGFFAKDIKGYNTWHCYSDDDDKSWDGFKPGIAYCEELNENFYFDEKQIRFVDKKYDQPQFDDIVKWVYKEMLSFSGCESLRIDLDTEISLVSTKYGEFVLATFSSNRMLILLVRDGEMHTVNVAYDLGKYSVLDKHTIGDIILMNKFGIDFEELKKYYDVSWYTRPGWHGSTTSENTIAFFGDFHDTLKMEPMDSNEIPDALTSYFCRKGIVRVYRSKLKRQVKYGFFDLSKLFENIKYIDEIADLDEVQDYLDSINNDAEAEIKRMIKSGTIKIKI